MPQAESRIVESRRSARGVAERTFYVTFEDGRSNYGQFTYGPHRGSTVRVTFTSAEYFYDELPLNLVPQPDYYLVIRGKYETPTAQTPTVEYVYLHDRSKPDESSFQAMIYPRHPLLPNKRWILTDEQKRQLGWTGDEDEW